MSNQARKNMCPVTLGELCPTLSLADPVCQIGVSNIVVDSRKVGPGDCFVALNGASFNGMDFIDEVILRKASAIFVEVNSDRKPGVVEYRSGVVIIAVEQLPERVSELAGACLAFPSKMITTIGVTGTNGKSTVVSLVSQLSNLTHEKAASMGTVGVEFEGVNIGGATMTTPDAATCQKNIAQLVDLGAELVAMEVSSHGIAQNRVQAIDFDVAVFTNLTHDHLDYHGTIDNYCAVKKRLFERDELKAAVINLDDAYASQMLFASKDRAKVYTYSLMHFVADFYASNLEYSEQGVEFDLTSPWGLNHVKSPLFGCFNVHNLLAAITALCACGSDFESVINVIPHLKGVPGRMQKALTASDITVLVDYAHTPDGLDKAIQACLTHTVGRILVVFGCGGDRDATKRPEMARVAESLADQVIVTSDNPRTESAGDIVKDIIKGFSGDSYLVLDDRAEAIDYAIAHAKAGDTVLIAGKGHETYQIIGDEVRDFDDMKMAEQALSVRNSEPTQGLLQ